MHINLGEFCDHVFNIVNHIITISLAKFAVQVRTNAPIPAQSKPRIEQPRSATPNVKTAWYKHKTSIIIFIVIAAAGLEIIGTLLRTIYIPPITPSPTPTATEVPTGSPPPGINDVWLDELDSILPRKRAFFVKAWNSYIPVEVGNTIYPHCIGVCIPKEVQEAYYEENSPDRQVHSEYIEYSLSNKYQSFQFDYGIDDCSFPDYVEEESLCEFNIVVQSCNSTEFLKEHDNVLFDSGWINYRCGIHRIPEIDVSGCEALRITVTWSFYVRQDRPLAFNIAILNPILRVEKFNIKSITKPDSIY